MSLAFVFPGQGSQYVGMGKSLYERFPAARRVFDMADEILGFKISEACFCGPDETLKQTYITQPAIFTHSMAAAAVVPDALKPGATAGHSLGEYSALVYAGVFSFQDALQLVILRGKLMQRAGETNKGTMAAVIGLSSDLLERICADSSNDGVVQIANLNSPGQIVISGDIAGVKKAMNLAKQHGAKMVKELPVHGAFHSPLMASAKGELKAALDSAKLSQARVPVYMNVTAEPTTSAEHIRNLLHNQLTSPVRWEQTVRNMLRDGCDEFIEIGPGKVLQGLIKRIYPTVKVSGIDTADDLNP